MLYSTILAVFLLPEFASAQGSVSASAPIRAEVREGCRNKPCRGKPPKPPDDEDDEANGDGVQSFMGSAEVVTVEGKTVLPSHVILGRRPEAIMSTLSPVSRWWVSLDQALTEPDDRSVWWEWWGTDDEHALEAAYNWFFTASPGLPADARRTPGVITIVAEY